MPPTIFDANVPQNDTSVLAMGAAAAGGAEGHSTSAVAEAQASNALNGTPLVRPDALIQIEQFRDGLGTGSSKEVRKTLITQYLTSAEGNYDIYAELPKPTPNSDPDNCFKCKNPGDFINCSSCEKPYHLFCADLDRMPDRVWECFECQHISRERLIRNLKEKQREKVRERELKKEKDRLEREFAKKHREEEQKMRREVKEQRKNALKTAKFQQQEQRKQALAELTFAAELRAQQMVMGPDGKPVLASSLRQTTLKTEKRKRVKSEHVLTPAERERIDRNRLLKQQFMIFSQMYPEYVERNSVRYPIPDAFIAKMPELHGGVLEAKPTPMKINMEAERFECLLYIWEFGNNFSEFLQTPTFKIEELAACLSYTTESDPCFQLSIDEAEELDWTEKMQRRHINEMGFHMVNNLLTALAQCYLRDMFPVDPLTNGQSVQAAISSGGENQNQILASIDKLIEDKQKLWPEIIRLILAYAKSYDVDVFGPFDEEMEIIQQKLIGIKPAQFMATFTEHEKVTLLTVLIDCIHETNEFRLFLNRRVEDKSTYNKEKMEVYQQIRDLETRQQEFVKQHAEDESNMTQEQMSEQIHQLKELLKEASRTEARPLKDQILALERQKHYYQNQLATFNDQIKKKQRLISSLNEKTHKASIKTTMLGKDSARSEYWNFKDDNTRLYIRMEEEAPLENVAMADEEDRDAQASSELFSIQRDMNIMVRGSAHANLHITQIDSNNNENGISLQQQPEPEAEVQQQPQPAAAAIPTVTRYSWFYYEREDQVDQLLERLNVKGQRERKLKENLNKNRDHFKLKKAKKVAALVLKPATDEKLMDGGSSGKLEGIVGELEVNQDDVEAAKQDAVVEMPNEEEKVAVFAELSPETNLVGHSTLKDDAEILFKEERAEQTENMTMQEAEGGEEEDKAMDSVRHVMFENDKWEDCITEAVWFGQKIPPKRRAGGRMAIHQKDLVREFFKDVVTLEACKEHLISISDKYMEASSEHDREWEDEKVRETWKEQVVGALSISELVPLINQLDAGMSLPTSLVVRAGQNGQPGKVQRLKLQLFKFWPSQDIRLAWKNYMEQVGSLANANMNSLYITLKILETACEQFSLRQAQKMEKKNKQAIMKAVEQQQQSSGRGDPVAAADTDAMMHASLDWTGRQARAASRQVIKYYESSESENEDEEEKDEFEGPKEDEPMQEEEVDQEESQGEPKEESESESSSDEEAAAVVKRKAPARSRPAKATTGTTKATQAKKAAVALSEQKGKRGRAKIAVKEQSEDDDDSEQGQVSDPEVEDEESQEGVAASSGKPQLNDSMQDEIEWEEYCIVCQDGGNVMCCESCPQVAHYQCVGLRSAPKGEWWCKNCTTKKAEIKQEQQSKTQASRGGGARGQVRQATVTAVLPKRSSRRAAK